MLRFYKYQGAGNDFILVDNRKLTFPKETSLIKKLCDRRLGIGADGFILIEEDASPDVDFKMLYYNADGKLGSMCGNGGRCAVRFANELAIIGGKTVFSGYGGLYHARLEKELVALNTQDVKEVQQVGQDYVLDTGSPHFVRFVKEIDRYDVGKKGREIRYSPDYKEEGINVNFVEKKNSNYKIRTYERGVESETLACGTGAIAAALCIALRYSIHSPIQLQALGGLLEIRFERKAEQFTHIWLIGPAKKVFETELKTDEFLKS